MLKDVRSYGEGHVNVPWLKLISRGSLWLLWAQYFCMSFGWYFYITWLPTYLQEFRHQTPEAASKLAVFPLLFGGFGALICGMLAARAAKLMGSITTSRRVIATSGLLGAAVMLMLVTRIEDPLLAMLAMGLASFANDLAMPPAWNSCMDIGGKYAGTVAGSMNMMGNLAGFAAPAIGGFLMDRTHNEWNLLIYLMAGIYVLGAMCWPFIDPVTPLEEV